MNTPLLKSVVLVLFLACTWALFDGFGVSAHQSGCHRWHSCPSDTGSYVCGDQGYDNYCYGAANTYYEEPDYESEGIDNGQEHADRDESTISSSASSEASDEGYQDGLENYEGYSGPDTSGVCEKTFTFDTPQPSEYEDAYTDSYRERCVEIYNSAYEANYNDGFVLGEEAKPNQDSDASSVTTVSAGDSSWMWFYGILGGFGTVGWYMSRKK